MKYAEFLAKICKNLLAEGITPAIWSDMLWMDPPLCAPFDRRTVIFDWNYYGHRPESSAFFKKEGFTDVISCPSDNSWVSFICYQFASSWLKSRVDIPVEYDEFEAFLADGVPSGVTDGCLTVWENHYGANLFGQWTAIARAGLYMSGKWEAGTRDNEALEKALFGRVTPYTEVTALIQDKIQGVDKSTAWFSLLRGVLMHRARLPQLLQRLATYDLTFMPAFYPVLDEAEAKLEGWVPRGRFEELARMSLSAVVEMIRAAMAIAFAVDNHRAYRQAALTQFEAPEATGQTLLRIAGDFRRAAAAVLAARRVFGAAIKGTGHTRSDLVRMAESADGLTTVAELLEQEATTVATLPLLRFDKLLSAAAKKTPLLPL